MYRYGDGAPFPFDGNFLDTVAGAVEACTAMFAAAAELDVLRRDADNARRDADTQLDRLVALERAVEHLLSEAQPSKARRATLHQQVAHRTLGATRSGVKTSKAMLERRVSAVVSRQRPEVTARQVHEAVVRFVTAHELPDSTWTWTWIANHDAYGELSSRAGRFAVS